MQRTAPTVLLGAQRFQPTLGARVAALGIRGRIATITAGWQERETDDADLVEHLDGRTVRLNLHARGEQLFKDDPELAAAHRERQDTLRAMQDLYRLRLDHAMDAERAVRASHAPDLVREEARLAAIDTIRELDAWHLAQCVRVRSEFEEAMHPFGRPSVRRQRSELAELLGGCDAVCVAGGHVAMLINRLTMFGMAELIGQRPVFAWSGGAMAVSERIVLFHDAPPQGEGLCEVLNHGLGLVPDVVVLPEPEQRLRLDQHERVGLLVARFAPAVCLALPARSGVLYQDGGLSDADGVIALAADGSHGIYAP